MDVDVVDVNHDGANDVILVNRLSGKTEDPLDSLIYWGNPKGYFFPGFHDQTARERSFGQRFC